MPLNKKDIQEKVNFKHKSDLMWPSTTSKVKLDISRHTKFQWDQILNIKEISIRKSAILRLKVTLNDPWAHSSSY